MTLRNLILLYLFVVLAPLVMAWASSYPARSILDELASAAGILAFSILLAEFLLSGRFRCVSDGVGLDVTLQLHRLIARSAVLLAVLHPFLYQLPMAPQMVWDTKRMHSIPSDFVSLAGGIVAWLLLPTLVLLALFRTQLDYRYETWRVMHGIGATLIALAALHHSLWAGRYAQEPLLAGYWILMTGIAVGSLVFVYAVAPLPQVRKPWELVSVTAQGPHIWEIQIEPLGHRGLRYEAGQFVWLNIGHSPFSLFENPFSIASAPADGSRLHFIVKEFGDFTRSLSNLRPGTRAYLDGPHGNLTLKGRSEPGIALIAGGVGVAPVLSLARQLRAERDVRPTVILYGNRTASQIVKPEEWEDMAGQPNTRMIHVLSEPPDGWAGETGLIDDALIRKVFCDQVCREWVYVICGPPIMMRGVEDTLSDMGVPARQVLSERFVYD